MLETTVSEAVAINNTENIHRTQLKTFLERQKGKFVSILFVKLDGSDRKLNGRLVVAYNLKGGKNNVEKDDRPYLTVFDSVQKEYRTVNLATVSEIRANRKVFRVVG